MKPVKPTSIIDRGIVIYVPTIAKYKKVRIEIFYSPKNPLFSFSYCQEDETKIWEKLDENLGKGVLFLYTTRRRLKKGFYKIQLTAISEKGSVLTGSEVYGLLKAKDTLYIGLPYSSFEHIKLT